MAELNGKVVLITGAARGIGAATARALAREGARLVLTDVDAGALEALASELGPDRAVTAVCDVRDLESLQDLVRAGVERFGGIDMVLANAGIASYGSVLAVEPETFARVIDVNVTGVFNTVRAALPSVIERRGYILIVSSLAAFAPSAGLAAYNASKAGVMMFADALRLEVAHRGVDVGSAHMSWIDTPLVQDVKADLPSFSRMLATLPKPLARTTSVDACAASFVRGLAARRRRVYVPRWVGLLAWLRPVLNSRLGDRTALEHVPDLLPAMDAEVQRLGRSTSARNVGPTERVGTGAERVRTGAD
jgi:NAD(P)-dependent dehydrogenase (short-subunit alcohol dehydrogenase family)